MKLIPFLKELSRHKRWVVLGPVLAALIVVGIAKKAPSAPRYTATKQVLVDSTDSSVPDASKNLATLIPRAGIYAQIMTNAGVMDLIGNAAGIPGDEIAATGPANTFGQTASHPATVAFRRRLRAFADPSKSGADNRSSQSQHRRRAAPRRSRSPTGPRPG